MKKLACIALSAAMALTMMACGSTGTDGGSTEVYSIGVSQYGEHASLDNCYNGFVEGLVESGLVEGEDFTIELQNAGFDPAIATQIAQNFSAANVDMMMAVATNSATACYAAAEDKDIPVIFTAISDPVQAKVDSGNITGTSDALPVTAQLELIRKLQPDAKTIGIIYTTSESNSVSTIAEYNAAAGDYGFTIEAIGVTAQNEVTQAVDTLINKNVDCMSNLTDNNVVGVLPSILEKTNEAGIPVYGSEIEQVKKGCVASAGIDYYQLGIKTGEMAAKIIKGEATCEELPYETVSDYSIYINTNALAEMNLTLPDEVKEVAVEA